MPGSQPYTKDGVVTITLDDDLESRRSVYFTDQTPVFDLHVTNHTDHELRFQLNLDLRIEDYSPPQPEESSFEDVYGLSIPPKKTVIKQYKPGLMPIQGSAVVGVRGAGYLEPEVNETEDLLELPRDGGFRTLSPLHSFMVYDRSFYKVNYLLPRWAQYTSAVLAVLIILVGVLQLL